MAKNVMKQNEYRILICDLITSQSSIYKQAVCCMLLSNVRVIYHDYQIQAFRESHKHAAISLNGRIGVVNDSQ